MADRFYVPYLGTSPSVRLEGDEAHHLSRVSRVRLGDRVQLFDGSGVQCEAVVERVGKREVLLSVLHRETADRELPFPFHLGSALPKGDRLQFLIEKATELGVTRFVPLVHDRGTQQPRGANPDRMRRWVIEASKQCGRNVLMEISDPVQWEGFLDFFPRGMIRLIAHPSPVRTGETWEMGEKGRTEKRGGFGKGHVRFGPSDDPLAASGGQLGAARQPGMVVAVGPEGGLTEREVARARERGWRLIGLGPRILRVETAALALVAMLTLGDESIHLSG